MTRLTRRSQRASSTALILLLLAITTGWTQAATPTVHDGRPADGAPLREAAALPLAALNASNLMAYRESEAALAITGRALYQAHVVEMRAAPPAPVRVETPVSKTPVVKAKVVKAPAVKTPAVKAAPTYSGTSHFWFPALGISKSVHMFECTRSRAPDNYVYRWGCAGKNNVYLLGHAASVFRSLHDAYLSGRLRVGMVAIYADSKGRITKFKVTSWRVVKPENAAWAIASQPVPSMTLQTCIGLKRLNVRLVAIN
ncbi:MAG TPA: sortase [Candidatus Limnocylindrales bacterium]|jgi:hypothetical protein